MRLCRTLSLLLLAACLSLKCPKSLTDPLFLKAAQKKCLNARTDPIHIIPREHWLAWLDPATPVAEALQFVAPYTERPMKSYRVTSKMNASRYEAKDAIGPIDPDKFTLE